MTDFKIYYGLEYNPFEKGQKEVIVNTFDYKELSARLNYLRDVCGIGLVTGRAGCGKTFALKQFSDTLNQGLYKTIYMPMSTLTTIEFYRCLSEELGLEPCHKKIDNFKNIQEFIRKMVEEKRIVPVIILDEAQFLKTEILNDLIMLLNFNFDSKNYVILILAGTPVLNHTLNKGIHEALKQRITIQYNVGGIDREEVKIYIHQKLKLAGRNEPLITEDGITAISNAIQGSTRKLNAIITHAMIIGANKNKMMIDNEIIMEATNEIG